MAKTNTASDATAPMAAGPNGTGRLFFRLGAAATFLVSFIIYVMTMARSAPFWDAGEFIASAYTLGVPHSPGTPLYVLIGRVFTLLPLPLTVAGKVNFMSALSASLGALVLYLLVVRFLDGMLGKSQSLPETVVKVTGALTGALFIVFSDTFWWNAVETEVYSMSVFIMGVMTWLVLKWSDNPKGEKSVTYIYLMFYLAALSVGLSLGTVLAFSGIFFLVFMTKDKAFSNWNFFLACFGVAIFVADATLYRDGGFTLALLAVYIVVLIFNYTRSKSVLPIVCTALFFLGISVHFYLMIRSRHNPLIDEGNPETWRALYAVLRREQYPPMNVFDRKASWAFQFQFFNEYFQAQFQMFTAYIGKLNLGSVIPLALGVWGMVDQYSKSRKKFIMLFVLFLVTSLGMIFYLNFSDNEVRDRDYFYLPAFYFFAIYIGIGAGSLLAEVRNYFAKRGAKGLAPLALPALLFLIFPMFTLKRHFFEHNRSHDFVCREYAKNMLVGLAENAILYTNGDNDTFPLWYIQEVEKFRTDVRVVNLSLLNTPWYIRQLRDHKPSVDIRFTEDQIDNLRPYRQEDNTIVYVRDIAVRHILQHNTQSSPVYFAVTIPSDIYAPYRPYLEMEGLAYRVVPRKGENMINEEKLEDNVWHEFGYDGILDKNWHRDESTYQPPYVHRLVQNYAAAFAQLGFVKAQAGDYTEAIKNLEVAQEVSPNVLAVTMWLGWYYLEAGDTTRALAYYDEQIAKHPEIPDIRYRKAGVQERIGDLNGALETVDEIIQRFPDHRDAVQSALAISARFGMYDRALGYINNWLATHPNDTSMKKMRGELMNSMTRLDTTYQDQ